MLASSKRTAALEEAVEALQAEIATLRTALDHALRGSDRTDALSRAADNAQAIEALRREMEKPREQPPERAAPELRELNITYRAQCTGYVSLRFDQGSTKEVQLYVGFESPTQLVGSILGSINTYTGTVVRRGELWRAERAVGAKRSGVTCVFTPFA